MVEGNGMNLRLTLKVTKEKKNYTDTESVSNILAFLKPNAEEETKNVEKLCMVSV